MNCPECDNLLRRTLRGTLWCVFCQRFITEEDAVMPRGSRVHRCFEKIKQETGDAGKAARICQSATGQVLATGRKPRSKGKGK